MSLIYEAASHSQWELRGKMNTEESSRNRGVNLIYGATSRNYK
jgi:hypothetical protein